MSKSNRFYFACYRDNCGTNVSFHAIDGAGYTTNLDKAKVMTLERAQQCFEHAREFEEPLCADRIDAVTEWHVDCQYIPSESTRAIDETQGYYGFQARRWNGNDVYWLQSGGLPTNDFSKAAIHMAPDFQDKSVVWVPKTTADNARRRTIDTGLINRRTMITSAGLVTPERVKQQRRKQSRRTSGKTRINCTGCGRVQWTFTPEHPDYCQNDDCENSHANRHANTCY